MKILLETAEPSGDCIQPLSDGILHSRNGEIMQMLHNIGISLSDRVVVGGMKV